MVANHEHVEVFVDGVLGERPGRVGRAGQHVGEATGLDDVRRVAATSPLGVIGVDGATLEGAEGSFDKARADQNLAWMRQLIDELLRASLAQHPDVKAALPGIEAAVTAAQQTPLAAAKIVLGLSRQ